MKGYSIKSSDWEIIYPIGSIYMSTNTTSPATFLGGTWEQIKDRFLLCSGSTYGNGTTGGAATINLNHAHWTANHTLTIAEMPSHSHDYYFDRDSSVNWRLGLNASTAEPNQSAIASGPQGRAYTMSIRPNGGGQPHAHGQTDLQLPSSQSIIPPYLAVTVWKRTA